MTVRREFLGWQQPFSLLTARWLLDRKDELPRFTVLTPTSQSARLLRSVMLQHTSAFLAPHFLTPGALLAAHEPKVATAWQEELAWLSVLSRLQSWSLLSHVFPASPDLPNPLRPRPEAPSERNG